MKRWLFNLAAGVSLAICVAALALLVRSFFACEGVSLTLPGSTRGMILSCWKYQAKWGGDVLSLSMHHDQHTALDIQDLADYREIYEDPDRWEYHKLPWSKPSPTKYQFLDFGFVRWNSPGVDVGGALQLPLWFVIVTSAVLPIRCIWKMRLPKRGASLNACAVCGYDLRATPDRCPECGTIR